MEISFQEDHKDDYDPVSEYDLNLFKNLDECQKAF